MRAENESPMIKPVKRTLLILLVLTIGLIVTWWVLTPYGMDEKIRTIAYSVCHQNPLHTLSIGGTLLPLCSRCTGMFLGTLIAVIPLLKHKSGSGYPGKAKKWLLAGLALFFIFDGINSALFSLLSGNSLYVPTNSLRLFAGLGMGIVLANLIVPLWRQTIWLKLEPQPVLESWKRFLFIFACEGLAAAAILFGPGWLYYPIAILSVTMIPALLTIVYALLWILVHKKENSLRNHWQIITYNVIGFTTALVQIGLIGLLRFTVTGTWAGLQF